MGRPHPPEKVKLIAGLLFSDPEILEKAKKGMERTFKNRIDFESVAMDFRHTEYYKKELGGDLARVFLSFERPVDLKNIHKAKLKTNLLENRFSIAGKRRINIDPGYLDLSRLVLLTTKDHFHRIYLGEGIFAESTLIFKDRTFGPWPWTYPDYKSRGYIDIFNMIRQRYKKTKA